MVLPNTRYRTQRKYSALARQRMIKTGNFNSTSNARVTGWKSDTTAPATINSDRLQVVGAGGTMIRAELWISSELGRTVLIKHGATTIWEQAGTSTPTLHVINIPRTLLNGDFVIVETGGGGGGSRGVSAADDVLNPSPSDSWIEIA